MKKYLKVEHILVLAMTVIGVFLREYVIYNIPNTQLYDFESYYKVAVSVAQGYGFQLDGYPIAWQGMAYSTILGIWFKIFGSTTELIGKQLNVVMSVISIGLIYYIVQKLLNRKGMILAIMAAVIFLPQHIMYCNVIGSEVMTVLFITLVIAIQITKFDYRIKYPLMGLAIGLLALTKPFFIAYPLVVAVIEWMYEKDWQEALKLLVISFVAMALVIAPWTYRNYKKFDRFIPISYNSGFNLYINNNPHNTNGGWQSFDDIYKTPELQAKIDQHLDNPLKSVKIASDIEVDFKPEAQRWIKENFGEFLKLGVIRIHSTYFKGTWDIEDYTMNEYRKTQLATEDKYLVKRQLTFNKSVNDIILMTLSAFGLWFIILNFKDMIMGLFNKKKLNYYKALTFMNLSFVSIVYFVYEGQTRYSFIVLFLLIFATVEIMSKYGDASKKASIEE